MAIENQGFSGCGSTPHEAQKQCVWCGANIISECSGLKTDLAPDFRNCPACGEKIEAPEKTPQVDDILK